MTTPSTFGMARLAQSNLLHSWRISLSVALGVATATAVIVGALLVGDSMRGSLRQLTLERLGKIESVVLPGAFFNADGVTDAHVYPIVMFSDASIETARDGETSRASAIQVLGVDADFWELDTSDNAPRMLPQGDSIVVNESLARELGVSVNDQVTLRLPVEQAVPADSPLGRRDLQTEGLPRLNVVDIIRDEGLGRFSLAPNQAAPQLVFADRATLLQALDRDGQANVLLSDETIDDEQLHPSLAQLGLKLERVTKTFSTDDAGSATKIFDYYSLTSDRLLLPTPAVERVAQAYPGAIESMTYLANAIETLDENGKVIASVPYSIITAIDDSTSFPLNYELPNDDPSANSGDTGKPRVPLVINDWTAKRLDAKVGTPVRVAYYEPEVENGSEIERYFDALVTAIVPITPPKTPYRRSREAVFDKAPTIYNDPNLTPTVPGVTDQDSISDWDLPFQLTRTISSDDDKYWNDYRLTPKAYLPLAEGERLFGSRFGTTTGLRLDIDVADSVDELQRKIAKQVEPIRTELGWAVIPIRAQQLAASRGTTPFDALFLSLSFFVILSAIMLIAMLFRLGIATRLREFGTMLALGWTPRRVERLAMYEGLCITAFGVALGVVGGIAYASFVLWALRSWWVGAVTVPFLQFYWTPTSLVIGCLASGLVAFATMALTIRSITKQKAQTLLSGRDDESKGPTKVAGNKRTRGKLIAYVMLVLAFIIAVIGATLSGQAAAGSFVGSGMLLLMAILVLIHARLSAPRVLASAVNATTASSRYTLGSLAGRNASKHPLRSTLTIGLMATASFLIIAITAFRLQPDESGTGGFDLVAQSSQPIFRDLNDARVRSDLLGPESSAMDNSIVAALRLHAGQDASCNNLYQATRPTVLGIPSSATAKFKFQFSSSGMRKLPWGALNTPAAGSVDDPIPVIIDQNTAMWSLQMTSGIGEVRSFEYSDAKPTHFKVVGLLANSILQGKLMIGESNFESLFPNVSGYQYFLIRSGSESGEETGSEVAGVLENRLGDVGMDVTDTHELLAGMLAVQNTYLRTFQSLGALGLLLGTIGLAIAQLRGVLERRGELAIMRAVGFTRRRLAALVLSETMTLLLIGIGCGAGCAVFAVLPYALTSGLKPPIAEPLLVLAGITLFGMLAAVVSLRRVIRMPLLASLRAQ